MGLTFSSSVMRVLIWVSIIICYLYIAEAFPQKKDKQGKGEDFSDSANSKKSDKQGKGVDHIDSKNSKKSDKQGFFEGEGSEAADGDLSSTIEDTKAGTAMIENMINKLQKMNTFLAGIVGYWDNEAESGKDGGAEGGSEDADKDGEKEEADETDKEDVENEDTGDSDKDDKEGDSDKEDTEGDSDKEDNDNEDAGNGDTDVVEDGDDNER